jgi:glycosyltransferase involved in cell wall biosynthesis
MKILQIIPNLEKGGAERLVLDICNELQNYPKIELKLVTFSKSNEYKFLTTTVDWRVIPSSFISSISGKAIVNVQDLQSCINSFQPNIIHSHLWESEFILSQVHYDDAIWFTHFHSNMKRLGSEFSFLSKKKLTNFYEKRIVINSYKKKKKNFITISNDTYNYAIKKLPNSFNKRVFLLKNAINVNAFLNPIKKKINTKHQIKLISVGSLVEKKNHIFLIHIVNILKKKGIDVELIILGDGPEKMKIQELISNLRLDKSILLKGNVNNVNYYLNKADIYVHSAIYEPFGLVLLEAMAAGLPIVSLDGKGNRDIIHNNNNGFILPDNKYQTFADAIIKLVRDEVLYSRIQGNVLEYVKSFDIKQYVANLVQMYKDNIND